MIFWVAFITLSKHLVVIAVSFKTFDICAFIHCVDRYEVHVKVSVVAIFFSKMKHVSAVLTQSNCISRARTSAVQLISH